MKKETGYTSLEELPVMLNANQLAKVLGISRAGTYALLQSAGFPVLNIGRRLVVPKAGLINWLTQKSSNHIWR